MNNLAVHMPHPPSHDNPSRPLFRGGIMRERKSFQWLSLGLLAIALSGCNTSTARIDSFVGKDSHATISRLLIVSNIWPLTSDGASSALETPVLETALVKGFSSCGIATGILPQNQFSPTDGDIRASGAFSPNSLLVLDTKTFEVGHAEGGGVYLAKIVDLATKETVWQAQIRITAGRLREEVLASSIIDRLKEDSILCSS